MGRPCKLTPDRHNRIVNAVGLGASRETAAGAAGVVPSALQLWLQKGERASSGAYSELSEALKTAEGGRETRWLGVIERATHGKRGKRVKRRFDRQVNMIVEEEEEFWLMAPQWAVAAWKLERIAPSRFGRQPAVVQNIKDEAGINMATLSDRDLTGELSWLGFTCENRAKDDE